MRPADTWKDYELLDATDGNRLERWGETILIRPDPQVGWKTPKQSPLWAKADAVYHRSNQGGGEWEYKRRLPEKWKISCGEGEGGCHHAPRCGFGNPRRVSCLPWQVQKS